MWSRHALRESKQVRNYGHRAGNSARETCGMHFTSSQVTAGSLYRGRVTLWLWNLRKDLFFSSSLSVINVPSAVGGNAQWFLWKHGGALTCHGTLAERSHVSQNCRQKDPGILIWAASLLRDLEGEFTATLAGIQHTAVTVGSVYKPSLREHALRSLICLIFSMVDLNGWKGHSLSPPTTFSGRNAINPSVNRYKRELKRALICTG